MSFFYRLKHPFALPKGGPRPVRGQRYVLDYPTWRRGAAFSPDEAGVYQRLRRDVVDT